jgi:hypothetical protein
VLAARAQAHVVSISTGELHMDGPTAVFELRIPLYEVAQVVHPETTLLDQFRFGDGHLIRSTCGEDEGSYVCRGEYEFPGLHPDSLQVDCTLYRVTVPNHVHILTATQGTNTDQEVFDQRFHSGEVRFHPPSAAERIARDAAAGAARAVESAAGVLFLAGLALAARSGKEAVVFGALFLASEAAARPLGPLLPLAFSARFLEAVLALTVAYLAVEILLLPEGRSRWAVVAILGVCHGFSLAGLPVAYLVGALPVQAALLVALVMPALRMPPAWRRPAAGLLLVAGLAWFAVRLWPQTG